MRKLILAPVFGLGLAACGTPMQQQDPVPGIRREAAPRNIEKELPQLPEEAVRKLEEMKVVLDLRRVLADPSSLDVYGDPNQRPIRTWAVRGAGGFEKAYVLGHADGKCCPLVSGAIDRVVRKHALDSWFGYGVAILSAQDERGAAELAALFSEIQTLRDGEECKGQVIYEEVSTDPVATLAARAQKNADEAWPALQGGEQSLLLWYGERASQPALLPVKVIDRRTGKLEDLVFELSVDSLNIPKELLSVVSLDGIAQYITTIRSRLEEIRRIEDLKKAARSFRDNVFAYSVRGVGLAMNYRDENTEKDIRRTLSRADDLIAKWNAVLVLSQLNGGSPLDEYKYRLEVEQKIANLGEVKLLAQQALSAIVALPYQPGPDRAEIEYGKIEHEDLQDKEAEAQFKQMLKDLQALDFSEEKSVLQEELKKARRLRSAPPEDSVPILVDSALRGWPASFSDEKAEKVFDRWMEKAQPEIWRAIRAQLEQSGHSLGGEEDGPGLLKSSSLLFKIVRRGDRLKISPFYAFAGPFFQVFDPAAGLVRYEPAVGDQNLVQLAAEEVSP